MNYDVPSVLRHGSLLLYLNISHNIQPFSFLYIEPLHILDYRNIDQVSVPVFKEIKLTRSGGRH